MQLHYRHSVEEVEESYLAIIKCVTSEKPLLLWAILYMCL